MRDAMARMHGSEHAEVVAIAGSGIGHARVAKQQREDGREGGPHDERGEKTAGGAAKCGLSDFGNKLEMRRGAGCGLRSSVRGGVMHGGQRSQVHGYVKRRDEQH